MTLHNMDPRLNTKLITFNKDLSDASGSTPYTGVGFCPNSVVIIGAGVGTTGPVCIAVIDQLFGVGSVNFDKTTLLPINQQYIYPRTTAIGDFQYGFITSWDPDGFTIAWTKAGGPSGIVTFYALCFR